jgi:Phage related hypothetical protein (DUF1799)
VFDGGLYQGEEIDDARADAIRWGLDPADFALPETDEGIWEMHVPVVQAFLAVRTQLVFVAGAMGNMVCTGLDYARARAGLRMAGIRLTADQFADLQLVEQGAMQALNRPVPA